MYRHIRKLVLVAICLAPSFGFAADGTAESNYNINPVVAGLVSLIIILLLIIGIAARVLIQLSSVYRDRIRSQRKKSKALAPAILIALMLCSGTVMAEDTIATNTYISGIVATDFYTLIGILALELLVLLALLILIRTMIQVTTGKPEKVRKASASALKRIPFLDRFNKSVSIEKEQDILLDHDYDGIQELDNSLPPWWKYGFYLTIVISVVYMWYYHVAGGPSSHEEFVAEVRRGEERVAAYLAANAGNIDEHNVTVVEDGGELAGAAKIYQMACAACHANDGGGGIGPNLTDEYWMHGGSINDIFKSIKYGYPDKGMKSWKDDYSPRQIAALTTYIRNLQGKTPANPKEPQGTLYSEGTEVDVAIQE